ncbi:MAG: hypothetical protein ICV73_10785, partial [Acetobacteraceae bacterium]|nr:hypothetical protein [Acetobacteraceae bacterium]
MAESGPPVSAEGFAEVVRTRNRLSRLRPNDPAKQADRLLALYEGAWKGDARRA